VSAGKRDHTKPVPFVAINDCGESLRRWRCFMHWRRPVAFDQQPGRLEHCNTVLVRLYTFGHGERRQITPPRWDGRRCRRPEIKTASVIHSAGQWKPRSSTRSIDQPRPPETVSDDYGTKWLFSSWDPNGTPGFQEGFYPCIWCQWVINNFGGRFVTVLKCEVFFIFIYFNTPIDYYAPAALL